MNPYTDQKNSAYSGMLTALFPEQTKTVPRIVVWSLVFIMDLALVIGGSFCCGVTVVGMNGKWIGMLLIAAVVLLFWLQGKIWYGIAGYFQKRNELG
jgi:hypothetical protein